MAIGEDEAVRRHDDAGAGAAAIPIPAAVGGGAVGRADGKPDHGRADAVDHIDDGVRIGVKQRLVFGRNGR
jgi:hypothetical protein